MINIQIQADVKYLEKHLDASQRKHLPAAINAALNRTADQTWTAARRHIDSYTGFKIAQIKAMMAFYRSNPRKLAAILKAPRFAPNMIRYGARQNKIGVTAKPGKKMQLFRGHFIANKGRTVFHRTTKARLPIEPTYGYSLRREFARQGTIDVMDRAAAEVWAKRLKHEIDRRIQEI